MSRTPSPSVVIVGAGPRGTGLLEQLAANIPAVYQDPEIDVHLVDPFPAGGCPIRRWSAPAARC
ncbi:FAD/NAD(P)-binding protein [Streptomyces sp. NPDC007861]|uniref:FAD/NAD(P)-binding protein n=1 Tax=Streptomyces sp. NPDC007861 TaxID=3154893 RepID=UPI003407018D